MDNNEMNYEEAVENTETTENAETTATPVVTETVNNSSSAQAPAGDKMRERPTIIWSFMGIVGFFVSYFCGTRNEKTLFFINQGLLFSIFSAGASILCCFIWIPFFGWILYIAALAFNIFLLVNLIINFVKSFHDIQRPFPLIGGITIIKG